MLAAQGLEAGLRLLNDPVAHRYTGLFRLDQTVFRNLSLYDKQGQVRPEFLAEVPFEHSFCQFVLRDGSFCTEHSGADGRLQGHKYQGALLSYHGVPVLDRQGELYGTLCHFDADQRSLPDDEFDFMQQAARTFSAYMQR